MKINLFDGLPGTGKLGIVTDWKRLIDGEDLVFKVDRNGELCVGQRTYRTVDNTVYVPQYTILLGESHVITFTDESGNKFACGVIKRTGSRMIEIKNDLDSCFISLCAAYNDQHDEIKRLSDKLKLFEEKIGISII